MTQKCSCNMRFQSHLQSELKKQVVSTPPPYSLQGFSITIGFSIPVNQSTVGSGKVTVGSTCSSTCIKQVTSTTDNRIGVIMIGKERMIVGSQGKVRVIRVQDERG